MGDRGRIVLPADVRRRHGFVSGMPLALIESPQGLVIMTRDQLKERVRTNYAGLDLVEELLTERRLAAAQEDQG